MSAAPRRRAVFLPLATCASMLMGCSTGTESGKALSQLSAAEIRPGSGMGELKIGDSLQSVTQRYGAGFPAAIVTDDYWVELSYRKGDLALLFPLREECRRSLESAGRVIEQIGAISDPASFFARHAACAGEPLASIALSTEDPADPAFHGVTDRGIHLGSNRDEVLAAYGPPSERPSGTLYAGENADDDRLDAAFYTSGIALYLTRPDSGELWQVKRILIFGV